MLSRAPALCAVLCAACYTGVSPGPGGDGDDAGSTGAAASDAETGEEPPVPDEVAAEIGISGLRRLSIAEFRQSVIDLVGLDAEQAEEILPRDTLTPFDNDFTVQTASEPLIGGLEILAGDIADAVVADPALRSAVVPCQPAGPDDGACFREFVTRFGRLILRRPLEDAEIDAFTGLRAYGVDVGDFWAGVGAALRAFLQHPEFIYRVEVGVEVPDNPQLRRLTGYEIASRLSFFLHGSTPPRWLIDAAEAGDLDDAEGIIAAADALLDHPRARARIGRFHALWLSYEKLSDEGLFRDMRTEADALVERIVFDDRRPWTDMLTSDETFLTTALAEHYGLPAPDGNKGWVSYGNSGRAGILSTGAFLSARAKFGDTSPTQRGLLIRTQLFCEEIPPPPPDLMVDVDEPPMTEPDACKIDRYFMSRDERCSSCHALLDPIGFGLENYDATGAFRTTELDRPECTIPGDGNFAGVGEFNGPAELAALAVESGKVEACVSRQLYRFAVGRLELDEHDEALLERLVDDSSEPGESVELFGFIAEYVGSEAFRYQRLEEAP